MAENNNRQMSGPRGRYRGPRPKLKDPMDQMRRNLAAHLGIGEDQVNVKATTTEGMGFEGEGLGISAHAVCCLEEKRPHA